MTSVYTNISWRSWQEKAAYLDGCALLESTSAPVQRIAAMFSGIKPDSRRAHAIYQWVRDRIRYVRDPKGPDGRRREEFADCPTILARRFDDCDGKVRVFCAICHACDLDVRVRPVVRNLGAGPDAENFVHVQAEIFLPDLNHPNRRPDGWLPVELILAAVPMGYGCERAQRDSRGQYIYT